MPETTKEMVLLDVPKLEAEIKKQNLSYTKLSEGLGKYSNYMTNVRKAGKMSRADMNRLCWALNFRDDLDHFVLQPKEPAKKNEAPADNSKLLDTLNGIQDMLITIDDATKAIAKKQDAGDKASIETIAKAITNLDSRINNLGKLITAIPKPADSGALKSVQTTLASSLTTMGKTVTDTNKKITAVQHSADIAHRESIDVLQAIRSAAKDNHSMLQTASDERNTARHNMEVSLDGIDKKLDQLLESQGKIEMRLTNLEKSMAFMATAKKETAENFLRQIFNDKHAYIPKDEIVGKAAQLGITEDALETARKTLHIIPSQQNGKTAWKISSTHRN